MDVRLEGDARGLDADPRESDPRRQLCLHPAHRAAPRRDGERGQERDRAQDLRRRPRRASPPAVGGRRRGVRHRGRGGRAALPDCRLRLRGGRHRPRPGRPLRPQRGHHPAGHRRSHRGRAAEHDPGGGPALCPRREVSGRRPRLRRVDPHPAADDRRGRAGSAAGRGVRSAYGGAGGGVAGAGQAKSDPGHQPQRPRRR